MCGHISIILPNRPGELARISGHLESANINILGFQLASEGSFGIVHILCDPHLQAFEILRREYRYYCSEKKVLIVEVQHVPGALSRILSVLALNEINLENSYQALLPTDRIIVVLELRDRTATAEAERLLLAQEFNVLEKQPQETADRPHSERSS